MFLTMIRSLKLPQVSSSLRFNKRRCSGLHETSLKLENSQAFVEFDGLVAGLNGAKDMSVKVISCKGILQTSIEKLKLSTLSATALGEAMAGTLLMASGLKGDETLQVNLIGNSGLSNILVISDSNLRTRGRVGIPNFAADWTCDKLKLIPTDYLGEGQVQVIRNHPFWKSPATGVVQLVNSSIATNLALYLTQSEQRKCALLCDVKVVDGVCKHALGVYVERLPNALDENVETAISNLENIQKKGLESYVSQTQPLEDREILHRILDDALYSMEKDSMRWEAKASFFCSCSKDKVYKAVELLPVKDILEMVEECQPVEVILNCLDRREYF